ncbi:CocE/NonD family hydrolase [uncultured Microscilla sp.]|uniref:CocE/NonD family hydrolase n=1 Tax=uncultured Microscilla sp. TaxID=432653 RepID=UPI00263053EB|nr:CocE/NonD family hydrolase [uncultured Microscilla sp.]
MNQFLPHLRVCLLLSLLVAISCRSSSQSNTFVEDNYRKYEHQIPMRDGTRLYTVVYVPKDASPANQYPILMKRTCYSCRPYGAGKFPSMSRLGPSKFLVRDKYIFVHQDVRGRWMSEGKYDNMRPQLPKGARESAKNFDESTDTFDTIEWLIKNVKHHNGKVGQWGISYPGFYAAVGTLANHPALKASSPQAPIADFFFDDFHHRGAYTLSYWLVTPAFGIQKKEKTTEPWYNFVRPKESNGYDFYLKMGSLKNADKYYGKDNFFWQQLVNHPNYDEFWQKRNLLPHLKDIKHAVMTVGGWFDAEDLSGPLNIYKTIEKNSPEAHNTIVMGPWSHGDWASSKKQQIINDIYFGDDISEFYQSTIEFNFFSKFLKNRKMPPLPEAYMFDTGLKKWQKFNQWPVPKASKVKMFLQEGEKLTMNAPSSKTAFTEFMSDPNKPVPYTEDHRIVFTPRPYMTDDQRFASRRPDVLVFQSEVLKEDITLGGELMAKLKVSTTGTDADWVVKLIDVYPDDAKGHPKLAKHIKMGGYQQMVRSEIMRGRFRESFEKPKPFVPNQVTEVNFPLQDVLHTFKKGHRIMIQVQSTWFPLFDRNPQKYVPNIFKANDDDFVKQMHRVYHNAKNPSYIEVEVLKK